MKPIQIDSNPTLSDLYVIQVINQRKWGWKADGVIGMPVKRGQAGVKQEMHKFKAGTLHSSSKHGPVVTSRKQAIAISLSEAGLSKKKK